MERSLAGRGYRYTTVELVTMAVVAAIGGVISAQVIAPIGNILYTVFGIYGIVAWSSLHVVWAAIGGFLVPKLGSGSLTALLNGVAQLLAGNPNGLPVVVAGFCNGLGVDVGLGLFKWKRSLLSTAIAGGLGSVTGNMAMSVFLGAFNPATAGFWLIMVTGFASGIFLAGWLGEVVVRGVERTGILKT